MYKSWHSSSSGISNDIMYWFITMSEQGCYYFRLFYFPRLYILKHYLNRLKHSSLTFLRLHRRCRQCVMALVLLTGTTFVPGYFQWGWSRELVSCIWAHIGPGNRQIPANLQRFNSFVSSVDTSAQSKDLDPVSVAADAENRSKTWAYQINQTVSGDTTKV